MKASGAVRTIEVLRVVVEKSNGDHELAHVVGKSVNEIEKQARYDPAEAAALSAYISKTDVTRFLDELKMS